MRSIFFSLLICCSQISALAQNDIDVLDYKFKIGLNDVNDTISGTAEIKVKFLKPVSTVSFDLTKKKDNGSGMLVMKTEGQLIKGWQHQQDKLQIDLSKTATTGDSTTFIIQYSGKPADGLIISKTKFGRRSFFADNWPDRGHNWIPCNDDPADKATVEFIVTAPDHYQVVANGIQVEETNINPGFKLTHWKEETPISPKVMVIGVAEFAVELCGVVNNQIPVYSWVYPENRENGFYDYAVASTILPFFIDHVGPYGYKKLANVQSKTSFGGLENANTIFYAENSVNGKRRSEGTVAHEIAHQWFGNMATEKSFGHLWLSEGFATYFTILYFENKTGKDTAIKMLLEDRDQIIAFSKRNNTPVVNTAEKNYMNLLNANSYQKGGWILHMLRSELGDSVFWRSICKYYAVYGGKTADTEDLQKIFEDISGKNLNQFFKQWLYTPGQPDLQISWNYSENDKYHYIHIKQLQKEVFNFPITVLVKYADGTSKKYDTGLIGQNQTIKFKSDSKIISIVPDPDTKLLASFSVKAE